MPPPKPDAEFPEMVELEMVRVPEFQIPPPFKEKLPEIVEAEIVRTPALLKAPPLPEVKFAPGPVMVRVPAGEVASAIAGSTPVKDIVAGPLVNSEEAKTMVSGPAVVLARSIASLKEVKASVNDVSCRVFTVIGAGLILVSR